MGQKATGCLTCARDLGDISVIRSRLITHMFREGGLIEKYGTGIRRILKAFRDYGLPEPKFEEIAGGFRVTGEVRRLLPLCSEATTRKELMEKLGLRHEDGFCQGSSKSIRSFFSDQGPGETLPPILTWTSW
jgi:predicted HTH transcriptional regulator